MAVFKPQADRAAEPGELEEIESPEYQRDMLAATLAEAHEFACGIMRKHGHRYPDKVGGEVVLQKTLNASGEVVNAVTDPEAVEAEMMLIGIRNTMEAMGGPDKSAIANAAIFLGLALSNHQFRDYQRRKREGKQAPHVRKRNEQARVVYDRMRDRNEKITWITFRTSMVDAGISGISEDVARRLLTELKRR